MKTPTEETKDFFAILFVRQFHQSRDLSEPLFRDGIFIRQVEAKVPPEIFTALEASSKKEMGVRLIRGITGELPKDSETIEKEAVEDQQIVDLANPAIDWVKKNTAIAMDLLRIVSSTQRKDEETLASKKTLDSFEKQGIVGSRPLSPFHNRLKGLANFFPTRSTKLQAEEKPQAKTPVVKYA